MTRILENDILFDDLAVIEAAFGKKSMQNSAANSDNDCSNYSYTLDEEGNDTTTNAEASF